MVSSLQFAATYIGRDCLTSSLHQHLNTFLVSNYLSGYVRTQIEIYTPIKKVGINHLRVLYASKTNFAIWNVIESIVSMLSVCIFIALPEESLVTLCCEFRKEGRKDFGQSF